MGSSNELDTAAIRLLNFILLTQRPVEEFISNSLMKVP